MCPDLLQSHKLLITNATRSHFERKQKGHIGSVALKGREDSKELRLDL